MHVDQPSHFEMTCDEPWFSYIRTGVKPVEGRKNSPKHRAIKINDRIEFNNGSANESATFFVLVVDIRKYASLEEYLQDVTLAKALPGVDSWEEALRIYLQWSTPEEIQQYGFLGIFVQPLD